MTVSQKWDKRVGHWHDHVNSAAAFGEVLDRILVLSRPQPSDVCVDLGAGTGFVTTALAPLVASVRAVDISPAMTEALAERAVDAGLANVSTEVTDLKDFRLPPAHADLIVSSYALHHLADADKRTLTARAAQWLCPGGRLVIADMMFGRGGSRRDRAILRQKVAALAAKGVGGWWRIAKNLTRYGLRVGPEHPATPEFWQQALRDAGLVEVCFHPVEAEAGIVCGVRPPSDPGGASCSVKPRPDAVGGDARGRQYFSAVHGLTRLRSIPTRQWARGILAQQALNSQWLSRRDGYGRTGPSTPLIFDIPSSHRRRRRRFPLAGHGGGSGRCRGNTPTGRGAVARRKGLRWICS